MSKLYGDSHRALQEQFDTSRMAALLEEMDTDQVEEQHKAFIESRDMFWLATVDGEVETELRTHEQQVAVDVIFDDAPNNVTHG